MRLCTKVRKLAMDANQKHKQWPTKIEMKKIEKGTTKKEKGGEGDEKWKRKKCEERKKEEWRRNGKLKMKKRKN